MEQLLMARKPSWLRAKIPGGAAYNEIRNIVSLYHLHTVCESALCPNIGECWGRKTATLMILGDRCTRSCRFCAVTTAKPLGVDPEEPKNVALAIQAMGLKYAVITSVARDDLKDGGADIWAKTIREVRALNPHTKIEVLIPDFRGNRESLRKVLEAKPDVLNHNVETVPRLQKLVRPQARYDRSLEVLKTSAKEGFLTKTGLMLGIGETEKEIESTLLELRQVGVQILTLGQYLRPSKNHLPIDRWVHPEEFQSWKEYGLKIGFSHVESGPLVRSSYHADEHLKHQ
ncbi:lipoyl synthase [Candidatus Methylacidiphilum fumarolicum]|uniref:Lipoyl synthase n=2 Tax=Candidatus Methylacidiphilum fumarolicum TaxID=591154 RepID=I0JX98_METFB|nr:lipoyl synthase [Candidatus Methylacidiphilum fumarolicum]MBW6414309.1 lipoyl synthase [Candidatus Methylacidiphilum fumarolicum]TFE67765.1 lipoyl synthase [Candidatus Methylacidiphilum fumarolicum]TFE71941.1 lipoyl synthase [Candidatus Methylacidiphilum fumarolicum]TFE72135.1 lipoyl synthase [Candidatus Methylacidiphilum fumarolicum]TFE76613.1 lipoyl synthase [Candidatus Methylacidiphilum fumarolicum]